MISPSSAATIARVDAVARVVEPYALAVERVAAVTRHVARGFSPPALSAADRERFRRAAAELETWRKRCAFSQIPG